MTDDQAQPPAIPTGDEDALTRADPIQTGPILRLLGLTLVGVLVGMVLADRGVLALDALQGAGCLLYTSPSPRDQRGSRMPSSA